MSSVSNLFAIVAGFIIIFFGNYVFYGVIAASFFDSHMVINVQKEEVNMAFIAIGCLLQAYVLTALYDKWSGGKHSASGGFKFGALAGLLVGFGLGLVWYGTSDLMDLTAHLVDGAWYVVLYGLTVMAIALIMSKTRAVKDA